MSHTLASAIELGLRQIARQLMHPDEYKKLQNTIRMTKLRHVGNGQKTLHDLILEQATSIADWATNNKFSEASDHVEEKKRKAIENLKQHLHHL